MLKAHRLLVATTCCCLALALCAAFFLPTAPSAQNIPTTLPDFPCYRTLDSVLARGAELAQIYPDLADWVDIGNSWVKEDSGGTTGYDIRVLELTNHHTSDPKPILFLVSALHARDLAPVELSLRFAEDLLSNYGTDVEVTWLLDKADIQLLLVANPDGRAVVEDQIEQQMAGEGGGNARRKNLHAGTCPDLKKTGVDLQLNFQFGWRLITNDCDNDYSGSAALSEPEAEALHTYLGEIFPDYRGEDPFDPADPYASGLLLNLISYGNTFYFPYFSTSEAAPEENELYTLANKLAYGPGADLSRNAPLLYGSLEDDLYDERGIPALTYAFGGISQGKYFMNCSDFNGALAANLVMLRNAAKVAFAPYRWPAGPEITNLSLSPQGKPEDNIWQLSATASTNRFRYPLSSPPAIARAIYSIDQAPWEEGAETTLLQAADGEWDEAEEEVMATLDGKNLQLGMHRVYVQAFSADDTPGMASVAIIQVAPEPLPTPINYSTIQPYPIPTPTPTPVVNYDVFLPFVEK